MYKSDGSPRLPVLKASVNSLSTSLSLFSVILRNSVGIIETIKAQLEKCIPPYNQQEIAQLSATTKQYVDYGISNYDNYDRSTYKGFIIKIETVPYTPTVNRTRAVGYNSQGIPLIQTELSFTANPQTLVSELKLIIDRDNLKAY